MSAIACVLRAACCVLRCWRRTSIPRSHSTSARACHPFGAAHMVYFANPPAGSQLLLQKIEEAADALRQLRVAVIDGVDLLAVAGVIRLQHLDQAARLKVGARHEIGEARDALSGDGQLAYG